MAVVKRDGLTKMISFPLPASTAVVANSFVKFDGSGNVINSVSTDATILGVYNGPAIASSNTTITSILVEVPIEKAVEWTVDVTGGTLVAGSVGNTFDLEDSADVNQGGTSHNCVRCTGFISASKGVFVIVPVLT